MVRHEHKTGADFMILSYINSNDKKNSTNHSTYTEEEMNLYLLDDSQKELVRNGEYELSSFEEDGELEEDDYYYED